MKHLSKYVEKDPAHEREKENNPQRDQVTTTENQFSPLTSMSPDLVTSGESTTSTSNTNAINSTNPSEPTANVKSEPLSNSGIGNMSVETGDTSPSPLIEKVKEEENTISVKSDEASKSNDTKSEEKKTKLSIQFYFFEFKVFFRVLLI